MPDALLLILSACRPSRLVGNDEDGDADATDADADADADADTLSALPARTRMLVGDDAADVDVDSDALVYVDVMELGAGR